MTSTPSPIPPPPGEPTPAPATADVRDLTGIELRARLNRMRPPYPEARGSSTGSVPCPSGAPDGG